MAETQVTPFNERFADIMSGLLFDVLKAAGVNWQPSKAYERIRDTGRRMALTIEFHAERKAIDVAKKLQGEVVKAFQSIEEEMDDLKKRIEWLEGGCGKPNEKLEKELEKSHEDITNRSN